MSYTAYMSPNARKQAVMPLASADSFVRQVHFISRGSYGMPVQARRVLFMAMLAVQKTGEIEVAIAPGDILHAFNLRDTGKNRQNIEKAVDVLMTQIVTTYKEDGTTWDEKMPWFTSAKNQINEKGEIVFSFNPRLKQHILDFTGAFTTHYFQEYANLGGRHSQRIFEIVMSYGGFAGKDGNKPGQWWCEFTVDQLRDMLAIRPNEYKRGNAFRQFVIDYSVAEINEAIDRIRVEAEAIKPHGKIIRGFRFTVTKRDKRQPKKANPAPATETEESERDWQDYNPVIYQVKYEEELNKNTEGLFGGEIGAVDRLAASGRAIQRVKKTPGRIVPPGTRGRPPKEEETERIPEEVLKQYREKEGER